MLDVFNIAKPQNCDIQIFYGAGATASPNGQYSWIKPRGVSNVYILLIGAGGTGDGTTGGGSGGVTVWYGAAQNVPDALIVNVYRSGTTLLSYRASNGLNSLLSANGGAGTAGGAASTAGGYFTASGFFQSVAGQNGSSTAISASSTTFLSGGANGVVTANYGYLVPISGDGIFQMQPIIVGAGGSGTQKGGIGCGGGSNGAGGPGMVLIASW
jgi:hypothetical protein